MIVEEEKERDEEKEGWSEHNETLEDTLAEIWSEINFLHDALDSIMALIRNVNTEIERFIYSSPP